jgi:hypothetical protein
VLAGVEAVVAAGVELDSVVDVAAGVVVAVAGVEVFSAPRLSVL